MHFLNYSCVLAFVAGRREPSADVVVCTFVYEKHVIACALFVYLFSAGCPSLLYVVVGAYPIHVCIHPTKLYKFFTTPPAGVICVIRSRKRTVLSPSISG